MNLHYLVVSIYLVTQYIYIFLPLKRSCQDVFIATMLQHTTMYTWSSFIQCVCVSFPKTVQSLWESGRNSRGKTASLCQHSVSTRVTDVASFSWIKGALLGKSPAPLDVVTQTLPALDKGFIWLCSCRCCGQGLGLVVVSVTYVFSLH